MKNLLYLFLFLFLSWAYSPSFAQTQIAKLDLVFEKRFEEGTVKLSKFQADGLMDLSSFSGPKRYVSGGNLKEVFSGLFPSVEFKIGKQLLADSYRLEIAGFSEIDKEVLDKIWITLNEDKLFKAKMSSISIEGYCISIENQSILNSFTYVPKNGIKSVDNSKGKQINLSGYTLEDLINKLNNEFKPVFFLESTSNSKSFNFNFSIASEQAILGALPTYGLKYFKCKRISNTYYLD